MMKKLLKSLFGSEKKSDLKSKFTEIHDKNLFFGKESISGTGSDLLQTAVISKEIPMLLEKYGIKTFIDAPCGDLYWMKHVDLGQVNYIGLDIVDELIKKNTINHSGENRTFMCKNIVTDLLPKADIILIRDCWVHLNNSDVIKCIRNLKSSGIKYLLTTSFTEMKLNEDLSKIWRPLNLQLAPFNFPQPLEIINEKCTENNGKYKDKCLILWEIIKLPEFNN